MSIDALIQGTLHRAAQIRTGSSGKRFATATVRTPIRDSSTVFASVIAFSPTAIDALIALGDGDALCVAGELTPKVYTPKDGGEPRPSIDLVAHQVLTAYAVQRTRKAIAEPKPSGRTVEPAFDDALPDF